MDRYECVTKTTDHYLKLIHYEGQYNNLPDEARGKGPWTNQKNGDVAKLKSEYRAALERDGYLFVREHPIGFKLEG